METEQLGHNLEFFFMRNLPNILSQRIHKIEYSVTDFQNMHSQLAWTKQ